MRKGTLRTRIIKYNKLMDAPKNGYLKVDDVAKICNITQMTVRRHIQAGKLKAFKIGYNIKITPQAFQEYLKEYKIRIIRPNETTY